MRRILKIDQMLLIAMNCIVDQEMNIDFTSDLKAFLLFFLPQFWDFPDPGSMDLICILSSSVGLFILSVMFNY